jgi:pyruvate kinase
MVTMPTEAAFDYSLIHTLLQHGMDCMCINYVRDDADVWLRMIEHLCRVEQALGRFCRVMMDLGGLKLRTGRLEAGPAVLGIRP